MEKFDQNSKETIVDLGNPPPYIPNLNRKIVRHEILFDQSSSISEKNSKLIQACVNYYVGLLTDNEHFTHEYQRIGFANALVYYAKNEEVKTLKGNKTFLYDAISNVVLSLDKKEGELKYLTIITDDRDESPMKKKIQEFIDNVLRNSTITDVLWAKIDGSYSEKSSICHHKNTSLDSSNYAIAVRSFQDCLRNVFLINRHFKFRD